MSRENKLTRGDIWTKIIAQESFDWGDVIGQRENIHCSRCTNFNYYVVYIHEQPVYRECTECGASLANSEAIVQYEIEAAE